MTVTLSPIIKAKTFSVKENLEDKTVDSWGLTELNCQSSRIDLKFGFEWKTWLKRSYFVKFFPSLWIETLIKVDHGFNLCFN